MLKNAINISDKTQAETIIISEKNSSKYLTQRINYLNKLRVIGESFILTKVSRNI